MIKQLIFIILLICTITVFSYTMSKMYKLLKLTKPYRISEWVKRLWVLTKIAVFQSTIFRKPFIGFAHALVFWGFIVILFGSIEIVFDGIFGEERFFAFLGTFYNIIIGLGDISAYVILVCIILFMARRLFLKIARFNGLEMTHKAHTDAQISLTLILLLMISLIGTNIAYVSMHLEPAGMFPVSALFKSTFENISYDTLHIVHEISWWLHIVLIFFFANYLPYSKHFHVFMSLPNVLLSRLEPLGKITNMPAVTKEVKLMLDPNASFEDTTENTISRFGVKDAPDSTWKTFLDALTCTQCGRCTSVCPANITGKKLSPRKLFIDFRNRMNEIGKLKINKAIDINDAKALLKDYISEEELWACTTCNACAKECPVCINHPSLIIDMRRYLVMEEGKAPALLNNMFANIENNGAPWQYAADDRLIWTENLN